MGVSLKRLWGWEPREFTEFVYDGDRLVGSVSRQETEFDREQVALLMAHQLLEADRGPHGFPMSVATDPDNQFKFRASEAPTVDWAAATVHHAQETYYKRYDKPGAPADRAGHLWSVKLLDD